MRSSCGRHGSASTGMWPATSRRRYAAAPASSPAARLRLDLEPDRQHWRADREIRIVTPPARSRSLRIPALQAASDRRAAPQLRAERHRSGLQVPAGLAQQHRRRPPAAVGHDEHQRTLYTKDVNGIYYINANLPAAQTTFTGVDTRPRWTAPAVNDHAATDQHDPEQVRLVLKNATSGSSVELRAVAGSADPFGLSLRGAYSYGIARARRSGVHGGDELRAQQHSPTRTTRASAARWVAGHRVFPLVTSAAITSAGARPPSRCSGRRGRARSTSSTRGQLRVRQDMNGDGVAGNDLIYIPRNSRR